MSDGLVTATDAIARGIQCAVYLDGARVEALVEALHLREGWIDVDTGDGAADRRYGEVEIRVIAWEDRPWIAPIYDLIRAAEVRGYERGKTMGRTT